MDQKWNLRSSSDSPYGQTSSIGGTPMKLNRVKCLVALAILAAVGIALPTRAQEKQTAGQEAKKTETTLKLTVVVTEFDGAKKISSLPYTFYVNVDDTGRHATSSVRMGLRVPVGT